MTAITWKAFLALFLAAVAAQGARTTVTEAARGANFVAKHVYHTVHHIKQPAVAVAKHLAK